jgi:hypothetical protein
MNNILTLQNRPESIRMLAAQRQLYKEAKKCLVLQIFFTVPLTILFSFLRLALSGVNSNATSFVIFLGLLVTFSDILINHCYISNYRTKAAKIQEQFDCEVYEMSWDSISVGAKITIETINKFADKYVSIPNMPLEDWYPVEIAGLSKNEAILICQKTNLYYDSSLRNKYIRAVIISSLVILSILLGVAFIGNPHFTTLIVFIIAPFAPIVYLTLKIYFEHRKSVKALDELRNNITSLSENKKNPTTQELRKIQNSIYRSRKDSALVPDFFYNWKRQGLEKEMHMNASR